MQKTTYTHLHPRDPERAALRSKAFRERHADNLKREAKEKAQAAANGGDQPMGSMYRPRKPR